MALAVAPTMLPFMRGRAAPILTVIGCIVAVGVFAAAFVTAPYECDPLSDGARSTITTTSVSLLAVGGLALLAGVFLVVSLQARRPRYGDVALAAVLVTLVAVGIVYMLLKIDAPSQCD